MKPPVQLPPTRAGCCLALACGLLALPLAATASDHQDHEQARSALVRGEVLPLKTVMERLDKERPGGQVLEVELERKLGGWVYEIKQMEAGGQLVKIKLDARTGELLERSPRKRRDHETAGGKP
jgi:uncharacterized membrane protein YkoI